MARGIFGGLESFLGTFGRGIISGLQAIGGSIADAIGLGREAGVNPALEALTHEWGQVEIAHGREPDFATLRPYETVPRDWFETSDIPWNRPFAYKVSVYGRDLESGRFTSQEFDITVSRELTIDEVENETIARLGATGQSPIIEMFKVKVIGAQVSGGWEPW